MPIDAAIIAARLGKPGHFRHPVADRYQEQRLIACTPADLMVTARKLMKVNRIRHLPVMKDGHLVGLLSISDVLEAILQDTDMEVHIYCETMRLRRAACEER
jgi:CBS domain-containing protein